MADQPSPDPAPPLIRLTDLLTDVSVLQKKEADDKAKFVAVTNPDLVGFRTKLIAWITSGYAGNCDLIQIPLSIPPTCSDGVARTMIEYVEYVSGVSLVNHIASIQAILPDFEVAYRCSQFELVFCVTRVTA